ncbi:MAG TPA: cadherin repeat domain-containing protein, partial [Anaerolineaceae bacterium]|nr:cadherin repeat domain-containing protein [Anaerolineaceae bacterium]
AKEVKVAIIQSLTGSPAYYPLNYNSPAVDLGAAEHCPPADQPGNTRPVDGDRDGLAECDAGSHEASYGPVDLALSNNTIPENQPAGTLVGVLTTTDAYPGSTFTYTLVSGTGDADNARFSISTDQLLSAEPFDFETGASFSVRIRTTDNGGLWLEEPFTITVSDGNDGPTIELTNTLTSLGEDADTTAPLHVADIVVSDDGVGTNILSLAGTDAALFEISGTNLFLKAGALLDFELNPTLDVTVAVDDSSFGSTPDDSADLAIAIGDVNEAPAVELVNTLASLPENTDTTSPIRVADILVTDDALGTNTLSLAGDDAALFEISGTNLFLKAGTVLDFELNPTLDVTVAVDDSTIGATPDASAALALAIDDVNEAPTIELTNTLTSLPENTDTTSPIRVADILVTDDALGTNTLSLAGDDAALFEISGTNLFLKAGTVLDFELNPTLDVTVAVDDSTIGATPDDSADLAITITDVDDFAPTVLSITRLDANPTSAASVDYAVVFSEPVTGVAENDFTLTFTGLNDPLVLVVSGSGDNYVVTVDTGSGNGTLRLDLPEAATITDLAGNPLTALPYESGETYTVIKTARLFLMLILR